MNAVIGNNICFLRVQGNPIGCFVLNSMGVSKRSQQSDSHRVLPHTQDEEVRVGDTFLAIRLECKRFQYGTT
jgi:hypothetical protein